MNSVSEGAAGATSLGIDFGSRSVKLLLLRNVATRVVIEVAGSFELPASAVQNGRMAAPKVVGKALREYLDRYGIGAPNAVFSIPSGLAVLRWLMLPELPPEELRAAAKFKVRRHLPFPVESAYIEAFAPTRGEAQCMIVAVPRDALDSRAEALLYAGVNPVQSELEAQSILRVVERRLRGQGALWRNASLTILDIGASTTHMYVVQGQQLQFIRSVKFGAGLLHEAAARELGISVAETQVLLAHPSARLERGGRLILPVESDFALIDVRNELERLTREFLRLMRYFRSLHPERSYAGILDQAVLCGGLVGMSGFGEYLEGTLGLRVELARPIAGHMTRFDRETFAEVSHRQEAFVIPMGLALAGLAHNAEAEKEESSEREFRWLRGA